MNKIIVPPEGSLDADITFIGQAPGREELRQRRPFCGPTWNQRLEPVLAEAGLSRRDVRITNVLKEHPSDGPIYNDEDIRNWISYNRGTVTTTPRFDAYVKQLWEELDTTKSNLLVPCGNEALYALTGKWGILKWRGSILSARGRKCIPIIHPAASFQEYMFYHYIRADMKRIIREMRTPEIDLPIRSMKLAPTYLEAEAYLKYILDPPSKRIAVDIEIVNEELSCMSLALSPQDIICIPFTDFGKPYWAPDQEYELLKLITLIMEIPNIEKVGHNVIFDTSFLNRKYGMRAVNMQCTMVAMSIVWPDFPRSLAFVSSMYTREPYYKEDGKKWKNIGGDETSFRAYNCRDSAVCLESFDRLMSEAAKQKNTTAYNVQRRLIEPLMYMQARGMRMDVAGLKRASADAEIKIATMKDELNKIAGQELNPNSPQQLKEYFYNKKKQKAYLYKGQVTTNVNAMKRLARNGMKEAELVLKIRKLVKLNSTYFNMRLSEDDRLRSAMNPAGTRSGRLSSSEDIFGYGGNVQNLPMIFRKYIIADEGSMLFNVDISQGENRIVAHIAPEPVQIDAFTNNKDMHRLTASLIFGKSYEEVSDESGSSPLGNGDQSERYWGKKLNHSLNYGMGYKKFALDFELPEVEAKLLVERWHQVYPGIRQYHEWVKQQLYKDRTLTNPYGRSRLFLERWGDELFKAGYDYTPQSTVAYKINEQGMIYIWDTLPKVDMLNQVHDSLVFQLPLSMSLEEQADYLIKIVSSLETPIPWRGSSFTLPVDVKVGLDLYDSGKKQPGDMKGVKLHGKTTEQLARELAAVYEGIRAEGKLQAMDWDLNDSSLLEEEV